MLIFTYTHMLFLPYQVTEMAWLYQLRNIIFTYYNSVYVYLISIPIYDHYLCISLYTYTPIFLSPAWITMYYRSQLYTYIFIYVAGPLGNLHIYIYICSTRRSRRLHYINNVISLRGYMPVCTYIYRGLCNSRDLCRP